MYGVKHKWLLIVLLLWANPAHVAPIEVLTYEVSPFAVQIRNQKHGLLIELVAELFKRASLDYQIKFIPLKRAMLSVQHSENQCVVPVDRSQERETSYQWISPVLISRYGLFGDPNNDVDLATMHDAKPYVIGSFRGAGIGEYLAGHGFKVELASTNEQSYWKLQRGRVSLWASELINAEQIMLKEGLSLQPKLVFFTALRAMACNLELSEHKVTKLRLALISMYRDGFIDQLYRDYGIEI